MYKYDLIISIFTSDDELIKVVQNIKENPHFSYEIKSYNKMDLKKLSKSDVVIIDVDFDIKIIKQNLKKDSKLILVVDKYKKSYEVADLLILRPIDYNIFKFYAEKTISVLELQNNLHLAEKCLDTAVNSIPDMFWIKDLEGNHVKVNDEFCNVVDKKKENIIGKDHYYIWNVSKSDPNSGADVCIESENKVIAAGHTLQFNERVKSKKGHRQLITSKSPLYDKFGKVIGTIGFGHDVTDFKNMNVENEILFNSVSYSLLIKGNDGRIMNINNYFESFFGVKKESIIGKKYEEWMSSIFYPETTINKKGFPERKTKKISGHERIIELCFNDITDTFGNITGQICIFRDVTLERELENQIIESSNVDFMTKLYNRRYLDKYISELNENELLTLFSIDLDHFKSVNDTFGHKVGDEAIIMAAKTLNDVFKSDLVVRMGGDEFLVVRIGDVSIEEIKSDAQKLLNTIVKNFKTRDEFKVITASIGITQGTLKNKGIDKLILRSDKALYQSKKKNRNCFTIIQK